MAALLVSEFYFFILKEIFLLVLIILVCFCLGSG